MLFFLEGLNFAPGGGGQSFNEWRISNSLNAPPCFIGIFPVNSVIFMNEVCVMVDF